MISEALGGSKALPLQGRWGSSAAFSSIGEAQLWWAGMGVSPGWAELQSASEVPLKSQFLHFEP